MASGGDIAVDPAFEEVTMEPGLRVWRIESFKPVPVPEEQYGRFYEGDSYIVFAAVKNESGSVDSDIHFWLGSETTTDEMATAARKTVELDQHLEDAPVQHREVQGHESDLFLSHFRHRGGVEYLPGGVASGFSHVEPDVYEPTLLHIKGKRNVRTTHVPVAVSSLNDGDVFILDLGLRLYFWAGSSANRYEKGKGMEVMARLYNARLSRADGEPVQRIFVSEEPDRAGEFWEALGGGPDDVSGDGGDDEAHDEASPTKVFKISDAEGELSMEEVPADEDGHLRRTVLDPNDVFVVDIGSNVYVWIGKGASDGERKGALETANKYIEAAGKPSHVGATVVRQHAEPPAFQALFYQWNPPQVFDFTAVPKGDVAAPLEEEEIDFRRLHAGNPESEEAVDDGSGVATVWRVHDGTEFTEVAEEDVGEFFGGDAYVVQYTYTVGTMESHLVYFWLGADADTIEKGSAAVRAVEVSDRLGKVPQIRVVQGKEPPHFCAVFKGTMIVHDRGHKGALSDEERDATTLYHVKGTRPSTTKAVEVEPKATNLNSGDCFVLRTGGESARVVTWRGEGASDEEAEVAANVAARLADGAEVVSVSEGEEDDAFWEALGGKEEYPRFLPAPTGPAFPRLFHVSDATGVLRVEEIFNFTQDDLLEDDVMILDTSTQVFIWVGPGASEREKSDAMTIATDYLKAADDGRDPEAVPIIREDAGHESMLFTCNFHPWDTDAAEVFEDPYEAKMRAIREEEERKAEEIEKRAAEAEAKRAAAIAALEGGGEEAAEDGDDAEDVEEGGEEDAGGEEDESGGGGGGGGGGSATSSEDEAVKARLRAAADKHDEEVRKRREAAEEERRQLLTKMSERTMARVQPGDATYTLEELQAATPDSGTLEIDFSKKEEYLSEADFVEHFGCTVEEFRALPAWKKTRAKKEKGIF